MRFFVLLMCLFTPLAALAEGSNLVLNISNINEDKGRIRVALYGDAEQFGDETWAITIREKVARTEGVTVEIEGLPAGQYAAMVYHDINRNRQFDKRLWLLPAEGYGLTNNPPVTESVDFANGAFELDGASPLTLDVQLNYCGDEGDKSIGRVLGCWVTQSP